MFNFNTTFLISFPLVYPFGLALFNTLLLLTSSAFAVLFHLEYLSFSFNNSLYICFFFGFFFFINQAIEFSVSFFCISDFCLGSIFFFSTGFHGFHVVVGLVFIFFCLAFKSLTFFYLDTFLHISLLY